MNEEETKRYAKITSFFSSFIAGAIIVFIIGMVSGYFIGASKYSRQLGYYQQRYEELSRAASEVREGLGHIEVQLGTRAESLSELAIRIREIAASVKSMEDCLNGGDYSVRYLPSVQLTEIIEEE